jgi:hypothetical protein
MWKKSMNCDGGQSGESQYKVVKTPADSASEDTYVNLIRIVQDPRYCRGMMTLFLRQNIVGFARTTISCKSSPARWQQILDFNSMSFLSAVAWYSGQAVVGHECCSDVAGRVLNIVPQAGGIAGD